MDKKSVRGLELRRAELKWIWAAPRSSLLAGDQGHAVSRHRLLAGPPCPLPFLSLPMEACLPLPRQATSRRRAASGPPGTVGLRATGGEPCATSAVPGVRCPQPKISYKHLHPF